MDNTKKRLNYIDCLRGLCMLFVVYHHMIVMGMRDCGYESALNSFICTFQMPCFFFISGFVGYKMTTDNSCSTIRSFMDIIWKKFRFLIIPTVSFFIISMLYYKLDWKEWIFTDFKSGYWFMLASFQVFLIYAIIKGGGKYLKNSLVPFALLASCAIVLIAYKLIPENNKIAQLLSLNLVLLYYPYFIFGALCKHYRKSLHKLIENKWFNTCLFFLFVLTIAWPLQNIFLAYIYTAIKILAFYTCFYLLRDVFEKDNFVVNGLTNIGKHTIEIYLLHFFLLFKIDAVANLLNTLSADYCFRGHSCATLVEFFIVGTIAIVNSEICIYIRKIIDIFPFPSMILFGPKR